MTQIIDAVLFEKMFLNGAALLEKNKQHINDLNVFPVPDGDTGTNMSLTANSGVSALRTADITSVGSASEIIAGALLRGARGNSGVILSLLFRGMSKVLKGKLSIDASDLANAFKEGVAAAYKAVMRPTEGTILTVSRLMADAAEDYVASADVVEDMLETIISTGEIALLNTTEQNPVLKKAGVVDAGGNGYLILIKGMLSAVRGETIEFESDSFVQKQAGNSPFSKFDEEDISHTYCTEFIISRENLKSPETLKDYLNSVGDSIVVVDDDEIIKVHVHTDVPGEVLTRALTYGSFVSVKIENMRLQHTEMVTNSDNMANSKATAIEKKYGTVAVCAGNGMAEVFKNLGIDALVTGGQTMNPSTDDILNAVESVPAEIVFVFPNNKNIIMAAEQCIPISSKKIVVIPTKTVPQGITSMIAFDETLPEEELTSALTDAIETVRTIQITYAARDSEFDGMDIHAGEYLALLEGSLIANESDIAVLFNKIGNALGNLEPEMITVYYGEDVDETAASTVIDKLSSIFPDADTMLINGEQPVYYYMISIE